MVSTSTSLCENIEERYPYIEISNIELKNLDVFYENSLRFRPYLIFKIGTNNYKTSVSSDRNTTFWTKNVEFYCPGFEPLIIMLMDRDEFDGDICMAGVSVPFSVFKTFEQVRKWEIKLAVDNDQILNFTEDMENHDNNYKLPIISLNFQYFGIETQNHLDVIIENFNIVDSDNGKYTEYILKIIRKNGIYWTKKFRYSEIRDLRNKMVKFFPELKKLKFPGKTYFSWLIRKQNTVQENLIYERKKDFEEFLRYVLKNGYQERSKELKDFIFLSSAPENFNLSMI